jgi:hypothetical protein
MKQSLVQLRRPERLTPTLLPRHERSWISRRLPLGLVLLNHRRNKQQFRSAKTIESSFLRNLEGTT